MNFFMFSTLQMPGDGGDSSILAALFGTASSQLQSTGLVVSVAAKCLRGIMQWHSWRIGTCCAEQCPKLQSCERERERER